MSLLLSNIIQHVPATHQDINHVIISQLSPARALTYTAATMSEAEAVKLYRWNMELSGALHEVLGVVEVVVRNAMDSQLRAWNQTQPPRSGSPLYTGNWIENPARPLWGILNPHQRGSVRHSAYRTALSRAMIDRDVRSAAHPRRSAPITHDDLVAHLSFGTWVSLLPRRQLNGQIGPNGSLVLWTQALAAAFPNHPNPTVIHHWASTLRVVRNRVAHMEPLLDIDTIGVNRMAIRLVKAVNQPVGDWMAGISRVPDLVRRRP